MASSLFSLYVSYGPLLHSKAHTPVNWLTASSGFHSIPTDTHPSKLSSRPNTTGLCAPLSAASPEIPAASNHPSSLLLQVIYLATIIIQGIMLPTWFTATPMVVAFIAILVVGFLATHGNSFLLSNMVRYPLAFELESDAKFARLLLLTRPNLPLLDDSSGGSSNL